MQRNSESAIRPAFFGGKPRYAEIVDILYTIVSGTQSFEVIMDHLYQHPISATITASPNMLRVNIGPLSIVAPGIMNGKQDGVIIPFPPAKVNVSETPDLPRLVSELLDILHKRTLAAHVFELYYKVQRQYDVLPSVWALKRQTLENICGNFNAIYSKNLGKSHELIPKYIEKLQEKIKNDKSTILELVKNVRKEGLFCRNVPTLQGYLSAYEDDLVDEFLGEILREHDPVADNANNNMVWIVNTVAGTYEYLYENVVSINFVTLLSQAAANSDEEFTDNLMRSYVAAVESKMRFMTNAMTMLTKEDLIRTSQRLRNENEIVNPNEEELWKAAATNMSDIIQKHNLCS